MPITLTTAQYVTLFEALDIPYTDVGYTLADPVGTFRSAQSITPSAVIKPGVIAYLEGGTWSGAKGITYVYPGDDFMTKLIGYLTRWEQLGTRTTAIRVGNVGDIGAVDRDPATERAMIRDRVRGMVPFWPYYVFLQKQQGEGSMFVPVSR